MVVPTSARRTHSLFHDGILVIIAFLSSVAACNSNDPANTQLGQPLLLEPAAYKRAAKQAEPDLTVTVGPTTRFDPHMPLICFITLIVPDGSHVPEAIVAQIHKGGALCGSNVATVDRRPDRDTYLLTAELRTPRVPGTYTVRAEAIQNQINIQSLGSHKLEIRTQRSHSKPITIEVKR